MKPAHIAFLLVSVVIGLLTSPAHSHPGHAGHSGSDGGLMAGLSHPLLGIDHLLAMVAVGIVSAQVGGRAVWFVPCAFLMSMAMGGVIGLSGVGLPGIGLGIAASVVAFGIGMSLKWKAPLIVPVIVAGMFGLFHGYAHGIEMPRMTSPALFLVGFMIATLVLHVAGVAIGLTALQTARGTTALTFSGGLVAMMGVLFALV